jgi:excisionase family DNA binding protein
MNTNDARLTMTVDQAAAALGVSRGTAYEAVKTGQLPTVRIGRRVLVPIAGLHALVGNLNIGDLAADPLLSGEPRP